MNQVPPLTLIACRQRPSRAAFLRAACGALLLSLAGVLAGCTSATFDSVPTWAGGEPQNLPVRPTTPDAYPPVHDRPPERSAKLASEQDVAKMQQQLVEAHAKQTAEAQKLHSESAGVVSDSQKLAAARDDAARKKKPRKARPKASANAADKPVQN
jgi:hypothetical protein